MTTLLRVRTIRIYPDPNEYGLAWSAFESDDDGGTHDIESGAYGDDAADNDEAAQFLRALLDEVKASGLEYTMDWDDGGCLTVTGPADHPIIAAAQ